MSKKQGDIQNFGCFGGNLPEGSQNRLSPMRQVEVATQDAKTLRTGGGYILNSMAKVEAQAFLRELRLWVLNREIGENNSKPSKHGGGRWKSLT